MNFGKIYSVLQKHAFIVPNNYIKTALLRGGMIKMLSWNSKKLLLKALSCSYWRIFYRNRSIKELIDPVSLTKFHRNAHAKR